MLVEIFNLAEAGLWFIIAALLLQARLSNKTEAKYKKNLLVCGCFFIAFGISDLIEAKTGAWWQPIELFILKAVCVFGFVGCYIKYRRLKKSGI